jgi:hypothetical protein
VAVAGCGALLIGLLVWHPWRGTARTAWTAPPAVPLSLTAEQSGYADRLSAWVGYVRDAEEDPRNLAVRSCSARLERLGDPPPALERVRRLAADACDALASGARDRTAALRSIDTDLLGQAQREHAEGARDLAFLVRALRLQRTPGGRVDARLSRVASQLAGRDVTARCFASDADWRAVEDSVGRTEHGVMRLDGFAVYAQSRVDLSPRVCRTLAVIATASFVRATHALEVLTHESEHLAGVDGIDDEAKTDCYAAQRLALTARLLGRPAAEGRMMGSFYLRFDQPGLPPQYRSHECRNGGRLDLRRNDDRFP